MNKEQRVEAVLKAQGNDLNAFASLFLEYKDSIYYVAKKMFPDENKALNIVYESCISVFRQIKTLNPASGFPLWVNMIAGSVCKRRLSKAQQAAVAAGEGDAAVLGEPDDAAQISRDAFDNDETKRMICSITDALPADQKLAALLYYFCGLKVDYIAQALATTPIAVKNRIFGAANKIKEGMYGFSSHGEKLYGVPAWLIASSFALEAEKTQINAEMTKQVFGAAVQAVSGKALVPPVIEQYTAQMIEAEAAAKAAKERGEEVPAPAEPKQPVDLAYTVNIQKIKERDIERAKQAAAEVEAAAERAKQSPVKQEGKKRVPVVPIILLVIVLLAAAAVFVLPKVTDGAVDPIAMVSGLFMNDEKRIEKADELFDNGDYEAAAAMYSELFGTEYEDASLYRILIDCYEALGDNANALEAYKKYYSVTDRYTDMAMYERYLAIAQNEPIVWKDAALGAMIEAAVGKQNVTPADLANVDVLNFVGGQSLSFSVPEKPAEGETPAVAPYVEFSTFTDLLHFANLREIYMQSVGYGDLQTVLYKHKNIETLKFDSCKLGSVPDFTMLPSLCSLVITNDSLTDVSPIANLYGLTVVDFSNNAIVSVTPFETLTNVVYLDLYQNNIEDVSALSALTNLNYIDLRRNRIEDLDPIYDMELPDENYWIADQFWDEEE